jgi:inositol-phosphate transport system permease protein
LTLSNWRFLTESGSRGSIWTFTFNSLAIAVTMTGVLLVLCSMAAYALSRMEFAGRRLFLSFTLILHGFPAVTLLIPIYLVLLNLGALPVIGQYIGFNTLGGIALVEIAFGLPFGVWLMKGFFDNISWDMERSALIDGASRWRTFWEVILPQIRPGLFALGIFSFVGGWNTYLIPATFSVGTSVSNLPVYIQQLLGETNPINWNEIAAIGLFQMIPILILFVFAQEYLLNIYSGGSKGGS